MNLLAKYTKPPPGKPDGDGLDHHIDGAGHDVIAVADVEVSAEDQRQLLDWGWHYDSEYESWCRFV